MEQSDGGENPPEKLQVVTTTTTTTSTESLTVVSDLPKKLARQLDFTPLSTTSTTVVPPEPPQQQQQQQQQKQLQKNQPTAIAAPPPTVPAAPPPPRSHPIVKPESPRSRPRSTSDLKDGTPKKQKQCNCKHSRCLKLYCECFASGIYCDGCNCVNCYNNVENEAARQEAVEATLERNPNAFRPKIASSPHGIRDSREDAGEVSMVVKHNKGCHCKKSGCLKKYCECFQANILCSDNCRCIDCKNFEGSEERRALLHGDHGNSLYMQQAAANAAITGAVGSSGYGSPPAFKRRKNQDLFFGTTANDPSTHRLGQYAQATHLKASSTFPSLSSSPFPRVVNPAAHGSSKSTYRSLLADVVHPQDVKELCSLLVIVSSEAGKTLAEKKATEEKQAGKDDQAENSLASCAQEQEVIQENQDGQKMVIDGPSSGDQAEKTSADDSGSDGPDVQKERPLSPLTQALLCDEQGSDGSDVPKERPMSPGTLALMCDEQDTMFTANGSTDGGLGGGGGQNRPPKLPYGKDMSDIYMEQERLVLTKFRDCIRQIITCGRIKEEKYASSSTRTEVREPETISNGVARSYLPSAVSEVSQIANAVTVASNNIQTIKDGYPSANGTTVTPKIEN
ncbi:hypothetical protein AQUCO_02000243v1 [Aquilegia coerulea]|uniref:CRC domain-containing protein n=1 Tax=Aquilegia coerulea TaxID=218851 RepID=A0A2G5DGL0_AQUCA|nr:hypothetical protein AQUCO_02000243v1 [Aquilegia coerulea]